jgi:heme oxygenase
MAGMATHSLDLENGKGAAFYNFEEIPNAKDFIPNWYQKLNELDLSAQQKQELLTRPILSLI